MTTVGEILSLGTRLLEAASSPSARLDAEVLLGHVLGRPRVDLYAHPDRPLTPEEETAYRALLERRSRQEPVSYLRGEKEFYGLAFFVDRRVLIPRPETEVLVERTLATARTLGRAELVLADIGTGSGCIAVALAHHLPGARLYATDISPEALEVAAENVRRHGLAGQVTLLLGDLCTPLPEPVDLLVSNPPYTIWETLPFGITAYEPRIALDGGSDGLEVYRRLLPQVPAALKMGGHALFEVGDGQAEAVLTLAAQFLPGMARRCWADYSGNVRVVEIGP